MREFRKTCSQTRGESGYGTWPAARVERDMMALEKRVEQYSQRRHHPTQARPGRCRKWCKLATKSPAYLGPFAHVKVPPSTVKLDGCMIQALPDPYDDNKQWDHLIRVIKAGIRGVRSAAGSSPVQIVIHIDCGGD